MTPRRLALAACSAVAVLAVTRITHASVGSDGVCYLGVADSLVHGHGLGFWLEDPLVTWPPLWPALIALGRLISGIRTDVVAVLLDAALCAALTLLVTDILGRLVRRRSIRVVAALAVALGPSTLVLAAVVQTEIVFAVAVFGLLWFLVRDAGRAEAPAIAGAVLCTWVAFGVRYVGLHLVGIVAVWLLLRTRRWRVAFVYAAGAAIVPVGWMLRNLAVSDTALGPRFASGVGPVRNTAEAMSGIAKFLLGVRELPVAGGALIGATVVLGAALLTSRVVVLRPARLLEAAGSVPGLFVVVSAGSVAGLVVSRSIYGFDNLDIRLLFVPILVGLVGLAVVVDRAPSAALRRAATTVGIVWVAAQLTISIVVIGPANHLLTGVGFNSPRARAVASSRLLDGIAERCSLYSNNPFDLYRGAVEAQLSPRRHEWQSIEPTDELERFAVRADAGEPLCLAWVAYTDDDNFFSRTELRRHVRLERTGVDGELTLYRVAPRSDTR